jgi:chromosomal replication initiation ATPase DnaA
MTTEQAVKAIASHLEVHLHSVPQSLLDKITSIINRTRTIVKKEVILQNLKSERPNLQKEWEKICAIHLVDPKEAKKGRRQERIGAKAHFVRYLLLNYKYINLMDLARFFGNDHTTIIHLRDKAKAPCPIPPFYQKKRFIITSQVNPE